MSRPLLILGTGGNAHDVLDLVEALNAKKPTWDVAGFLDDARSPGTRHLGWVVHGALHDAGRFPGHDFVNSIGSCKSFRILPQILASTGLAANRFPTLIHPSASVSPRARLGRGVVVQHGVTVGGGTVVGDFVTLCPTCTVGHDAFIGDYTILAPHAVVSGFVSIDPNCYIGAAAVIRQNTRVGERALIGTGAVVVREVPLGETVAGNPARPLTPSGERVRSRGEEEVLR